MNRMTNYGLSTLAAASIAAGALSLAAAGAASATAAPRHPAAVATCSTSARNYSFPRRPTSFGAAAAGSVTVAPVNSGTIRVAGIHPARGWRYLVDSSSGSSVDVYFHSAKHTLKFEAEINDGGGLTIWVTTC